MISSSSSKRVAEIEVLLRELQLRADEAQLRADEAQLRANEAIGVAKAITDKHEQCMREHLAPKQLEMIVGKCDERIRSFEAEVAALRAAAKKQVSGTLNETSLEVQSQLDELSQRVVKTSKVVRFKG